MKKIIFKNQEQEVEILYQKEISKISESFPEHGKMFFVCDELIVIYTKFIAQDFTPH